MNSKHTEGPWEITWGSVTAIQGIAFVPISDDGRHTANAVLISRAPELYALAERIAALTPATRDYSPGIGDGILNQLIDEAKRLTSPAP